MQTLDGNQAGSEYVRDQRTLNSIVLVKYVTPFAFGWLAIAYLLGAPLLTIAAAIATLGFLLGMVLHHFAWHLSARVTYVIFANIAIALASFVTPSEGHMSFIFVATACAPVVIFSLQRHLFWLVASVALPIGLWILGWATNYRLVGTVEVDRETALNVLAPATAFTVFGVVLFVIGYFMRRSHLFILQLRDAQRAAERASDAKTRLLRSVSHEMRTPLHAISGYAALLHADAQQDGKADNSITPEFTGQILRSSQDLLHIIENILDFVSFDGNDLKDDLTQVALTECLQPVIARFSDGIAQKDLHVVCKIDAEWKVQANPAWLASIFKQLLDNAIKFSQAGGEITISALKQPGGRTEVVFQDSGSGFPAGAAETAFIPFERLGYETGATSGVGIGLSLARSFATAMGCQIVIDENTENGGKVRVIFPAA